MPELPEVETTKNDLIEAGILSQRIEEVQVCLKKCFNGPDPVGREIRGLRRLGKYLIFDLEGELSLIGHLRMSGSFSLENHSYQIDTHDRVILVLSSQLLVFHDPRTFGSIICTSEPQTILGRLGPDALDPLFDAERFFTLTRGHRKRIKSLLLDQHLIAGLGNIYTDEALFAANIHPERIAASLTIREAEALHTAIRELLLQGIANRGTSLGHGEANFRSGGEQGLNASYLKIYSRAGKPCLRCSSILQRSKVAGRTTVYCPVCQPFEG